MLSEHIQKKIIEKIKKENPQKVILFGSYASDKYHADSDIDLYIVTNDRFLPRSFKEKMDVKMVQEWELFGDPSLRIGGCK